MSEELVEVVWHAMRDQDVDQIPPDGRILGRVEDLEHVEVSTNPLWPWKHCGISQEKAGWKDAGNQLLPVNQRE